MIKMKKIVAVIGIGLVLSLSVMPAIEGSNRTVYKVPISKIDERSCGEHERSPLSTIVGANNEYVIGYYGGTLYKFPLSEVSEESFSYSLQIKAVNDRCAIGYNLGKIYKVQIEEIPSAPSGLLRTKRLEPTVVNDKYLIGYTDSRPWKVRISSLDSTSLSSFAVSVKGVNDRYVIGYSSDTGQGYSSDTGQGYSCGKLCKIDIGGLQKTPAYNVKSLDAEGANNRYVIFSGATLYKLPMIDVSSSSYVREVIGVTDQYVVGYQ